MNKKVKKELFSKKIGKNEESSKKQKTETKKRKNYT